MSATTRTDTQTDRGGQAVAELLHRTRTARGMALVIDDPAVIARVAAIVAAAGGAAT